MPSVKAGQTVPFGGYNWKVLDVQDGAALVIMEDILERLPYHMVYDFVTWETCSLRYYLNNNFFNTFSEAERAMIVETLVRNPDNLWYDTPGGNDTVDRIFLLSLEEADRYFGDSGDYLNKRMKDYRGNSDDYALDLKYLYNKYNDNRQAKYNGSFHDWWLRSPGMHSSRAAAVIDEGYADVAWAYGFVHCDGVGVRPALWLDLRAVNRGESASAPQSDTKSGSIRQRIQSGETRNLAFGGYTWRVLDAQDSKALIITEEIVEERLYHTANENVTWETCTLRKHLNNEFYNTFPQEERNLIIEATIASIYTELSGKMTEYGGNPIPFGFFILF